MGGSSASVLILRPGRQAGRTGRAGQGPPSKGRTRTRRGLRVGGGITSCVQRVKTFGGWLILTFVESSTFSTCLVKRFDLMVGIVSLSWVHHLRSTTNGAPANIPTPSPYFPRILCPRCRLQLVKLLPILGGPSLKMLRRTSALFLDPRTSSVTFLELYSKHKDFISFIFIMRIFVNYIITDETAICTLCTF